MKTPTPNENRRGFTLIELLIVVAIIAILAAIAVPNFLEAQTRSKVSRTKNDMRTIATGIELYFVDHNGYPTGWDQAVDPNRPESHSLFLLSTPISYIGDADIQDIFHPGRDDRAMYTTLQYDPMTFDGRMFSLYNVNGSYIDYGEIPTWWILFSVGPDHDSYFTYDVNNSEDIEYIVRHADSDLGKFTTLYYDPTNGTISRGNIWRAGGSFMNQAGKFISTYN